MTNLKRFSPGSELRTLQNEIDRMFEGLMSPRKGGNGSSSMWSPRVDIAEADDAYEVHIDVPGVTREDLEINYHDGTLTVSGERKMEETEEGTSYSRIERSYGRFYRSFTLPKAADPENIDARYANGVLSLHIPKAPESKPRRIEIGSKSAKKK